MSTRVGLLRLGLIITIVTQNPAFAASSPLSQGFTYQGRLFTADGSESMTGLMDLTLGIYSANGNCLLYEERQNNLDLTESQGFFSVVVGSALGDPKRVTPDRDPGKTLSEIFANGKLLRADEATCPGGYTPANGEGRVLKVTMHPHGGVTETLTPDLVISPNPQTFVAETLQGLTPDSFVQVSGTVSQAALATLTTGAASDGSALHNHDGLYTRLNQNASFANVSISGTPTNATDACTKGYVDTKFAGNALNLAGLADGQSIRWNAGTSKWDVFTPSAGNAGTVTSVGLSLPSEFTTGAAVTSSGSVSATWASAGQNKVLAGPVASAGTPAFRLLDATDIPNLGWSKITSGKPTTLSGYGITDGTPKSGSVTDGSLAQWNNLGQLIDGPAVSSILTTTRKVNNKALSSDITLNLASADFANQGTTTTVLHGNAAGNPSFSAITEADLSFSDVVTGNASTTKHGFMPKFPDNTTDFLRADGTWAVPPATDLTTSVNFGTAAAGAVTLGKVGQNTILNGNVGIGIATPDTKLHINGTTGATLKIVDGNQGAGKVLTSNAEGVASWAAPAAAMTYPGAGVAVSTGAAWGTSLSTTELTGLAGLASNGLVKRTGAGTYTTDATTYAPLASPTFTGTVTTPALNLSGLTASTVPYLDASKNLVSSAVTPTQLSYLDATSSIQTQLNSKQAALTNPVTSSGTVTGINGHLTTWNNAGQVIDGGATLAATNFPALTGDVTSAGGSFATTVAKVNGTTVPTNAAADQALVTTGAAAGAWKSIPDCDDSTGKHLNYDTATHTFSCGTSSSSTGVGGSGTAGYLPYFSAATTLADSPIAVSGSNVGIGTTGPGFPLEVHSDGNSNNVGLAIVNANSSGSQQIRSQLLLGSDTGTGTGRGSTLFASANLSGWADYENRPLTFFTGAGGAASERLRITSTGNIGIGTANPGSLLDIQGGDLTVGSTSAGNRSIVINGLGTAQSIIGTLTTQAQDVNNDLVVLRSNRRLNIEAAKQVVISSGTGSAISMNYGGVGNISMFSGTATGNNKVLQINGFDDGASAVKAGTLAIDTAGSFNVLGASGESLKLGGNATAAMTLDSAGNVGIGITNPGTSLDVSGGIRAGSSTAVSTCGAGVANGEGTQRYNYTNHVMEYCNGTAWVALGVYQ